MGSPVLLLFVLAVAAVLPAPAAAQLELTATPCAEAIVSISPCLAHVALVTPPARAAAAPSDACCEAFLRAVASEGSGVGCFCHLLRDPLLLGFPVDAARLGALLPTCATGNAAAAATVEAAALFADTCRDLKSLPEMHFRPDSPPPMPRISPAAVLGSAPPTKEDHSAPAPLSRSGSQAISSYRISLLTLLLTAAAAMITLQFR